MNDAGASYKEFFWLKTELVGDNFKNNVPLTEYIYFLNQLKLKNHEKIIINSDSLFIYSYC